MAHFLVICDAEKKSGLGHYVRTQALISELENLGHTISWLFKTILPSHIKKQISNKNQKIIYFDSYGELLNDLENIVFDHFIVDSYLIPTEVRSELKNFHKSSKIISIQDSPPYLHSDIYINQNINELGSNEFQLPSKSVLFSGEKYMMLDYAKYTPKNYYNMEKIDKILVFFGGTSQKNLITATLRCLDTLNQNLNVEIFVPKSDMDFVKYFAKRFSNIKITVNLISINSLIEYNRYDLCIGSFGVSAWERIYVGLPSIGVVIAENQSLVANILSERLVILQADLDNLEAKIIEIFKNAKLRLELFENSKKILDGNSTRNLAVNLNRMLMC